MLVFGRQKKNKIIQKFKELNLLLLYALHSSQYPEVLRATATVRLFI